MRASTLVQRRRIAKQEDQSGVGEVALHSLACASASPKQRGRETERERERERERESVVQQRGKKKEEMDPFQCEN